MSRTNPVFPSAIRTLVVRVAVLFCLAIVAGFSIIGAGAALSYLLVRSVLEAWGWPAAAGVLAAELALIAAAAILAARQVSGQSRHSSKAEQASGAVASSQENSKAVVSGGDGCDDGSTGAQPPSPALQLILAMLGDRRRFDWAASFAAALVAAVAIVGPMRCLRIFGRCMRVAWTLRQIAQAALAARAADPAHSPR